MTYTLIQDGERITVSRHLDDFDILIRDPILAEIVKKVSIYIKKDVDSVSSMISGDTPFGVPTNPKDSKKSPISVYKTESADHDIRLFHIEDGKRKVEYVSRKMIKKNTESIDYEKVFIPKGYGAGETFPHQILGVPEYAGKNSVCSQSYLFAAFHTENEAYNFITYLRTKFFRALVLAMKVSQDAMSRTYRFVPVQDFSKPWTDAELYKKYGLTAEEIAFVEETIKPME